METHFVQRGYDRQSVKEARQRASIVPRQQTLRYRQKEDHKRIPIVVTHNPGNPPFRAWFRELQPQLSNSERMKGAMPEPPILAERVCRSLRTLLMPSTLPSPPTEEEPGCYKCDRDRECCATCRHHLVKSLHQLADMKDFHN